MSANYPNLESKKILITGATRGIGRSIALELARQKAHIFFSTRSDNENSQNLIKEIESLGAKAEPLFFDLNDHEGVKHECERVLKPHGSLDGLVNNAGMSKDQLLMRVKPEDISQTLNTNLASAIYLTGLCSRYLMKSESASIVNMSSIVGLMGNPGQSIYSASKAGLIGFTKSVAKELASRKVRANAICPGFIASDMTNQLPEQTREKYLEAIPLGDFGQADDVAALTTFLLSDQSRYITGESFKIDGGLYI